jgi:hypothetical protein
MLSVDRSLGLDRPHPFSNYASRGKTARDYAAFCIGHAKRPDARRRAANFVSNLWKEAQKKRREQED